MGKHHAQDITTEDTVVMMGQLLPTVVITDAVSALSIATALDTAADVEWQIIRDCQSAQEIRTRTEKMKSYLNLGNMAWREYLNLGGTPSVTVTRRAENAGF